MSITKTRFLSSVKSKVKWGLWKFSFSPCGYALDLCKFAFVLVKLKQNTETQLRPRWYVSVQFRFTNQNKWVCASDRQFDSMPYRQFDFGHNSHVFHVVVVVDLVNNTEVLVVSWDSSVIFTFVRDTISYQIWRCD